MDPTSTSFFLLLTTTAVCSFSLVIITHALHQPPSAADSIVSSCIPHEREALLAFKEGISSDPTGLLDSWQRGGDHGRQDCCQWRGIRCSNQTRHVLKLRLRNEHHVYSSVDGGTAALVGQISRSLLALKHLKYLDLSYNRLEGPTGRIPEFLGSLKNLKYVNLSHIGFLGKVPPQLGNLSRLQYLDLSGTSNTNSSDMSWVTHLSHLEHLDLSGVNLSTVADWPHVVNMVPSLRVLHLSRCDLASANQTLPHLNLSRLLELDLSENYFDQPIASGWFWNLTNITYLDLTATNFYGEFPNELGHMTSLQVLHVAGMSKGIKISHHLKNLCSLEVLDLQYSLLYGHATELFESLPRCSPSKLQELYLYGNNIHGTLPSSLGELTSLVLLDVGKNNITGSVPVNIHNLTNLMILHLSVNNLTILPHEIGFLSNLTYLYLGDNKMDNVITEEHFQGLLCLREIDLSFNSLKINISSKWVPPFRLQSANFEGCQMGPLFPASLQRLQGIDVLDISRTGIKDRIPHWFTGAFSNASILRMSNNQLYGGLPENMKIMSVERLDLSSNQLTGQIPPFPQNLTYLDISMNHLSGPLPDNFGANLQYFYLLSNRLTGGVSESICKCEGLISLVLANNQFVGELPECFGNRMLTYLDLSNNSFSGNFPSSFQKCAMLKVLDLSGNKFSGGLPLWIGKLVSLKFLRLSHNKFIGKIPLNFTILGCLQYMDIADNGISGALPRNLSNLKALTHNTYMSTCSIVMNGGSYDYNFFANLKGQLLMYDSIYRIIEMDMKIINLSLNNLTSEIPEDIATLDGLISLNLSWNHFSGNVPSKLGAMQSLESLDLSRNKLAGQIPASLSNMTFLSYLDLSWNNLTGRIPSGSQLDTLYSEYPSMYTGNMGLCGPPLKNDCPSTDASKDDHFMTIIEEAPGPEFFYIGVGCGFIAGMWVVTVTLLFTKRWRIAYYHLLDDLYMSNIHT